jgi:hypothetical protein
MNFGEVLEWLKVGGMASRAGWGGDMLYVGMMRKEDITCGTEPYLYLRTIKGTTGPWFPTQEDMLANDWETSYPPVREVN